MRLERTLRVKLEKGRRKGRKGRKLPATIRRAGFVNDINRLCGRCRCRYASPGVAETGGNWRKLPATTSLEKRSAVSLSHFRGVQNDYRTTGNTGNSPGSWQDGPCLAGQRPATVDPAPLPCDSDRSHSLQSQVHGVVARPLFLAG